MNRRPSFDEMLVRETPYQQIGETKFSKPVFDHVLSHRTLIPASAKCALLSLIRPRGLTFRSARQSYQRPSIPDHHR